MDLPDIFATIPDQDRGRWLDIIDPWKGQPTGVRLLIAGPDSDVQRRARIALMDGLAEAAGADGTVSFADREAARIDSLARAVLGWEVPPDEDGRRAPFSHTAVVRLLKVQWVQEQADAFAGNRRAFRPGAA